MATNRLGVATTQPIIQGTIWAGDIANKPSNWSLKNFVETELLTVSTLDATVWQAGIAAKLNATAVSAFIADLGYISQDDPMTFNAPSTQDNRNTEIAWGGEEFINGQTTTEGKDADITLFQTLDKEPNEFIFGSQNVKKTEIDVVGGATDEKNTFLEIDDIGVNQARYFAIIPMVFSNGALGLYVLPRFQPILNGEDVLNSAELRKYVGQLQFEKDSEFGVYRKMYWTTSTTVAQQAQVLAGKAKPVVAQVEEDKTK